MAKPRLRIGLIGSGFMGKTHIFGFATANRVFDLPFDVVLECIADATPQLARQARDRFGFNRSADIWQDLAEDPDIDVLDITAPNALHREMAIAGARAGKHVYCEKPLANNVAEALDMVAAAERAGVTTQLGFNYLSNPMFQLAGRMIAEDRIGQPWSFRGIHAEDYMADADTPWSWRHEYDGGGATADLGSHILATAEFLLGPIARVLGDMHTAITSRPAPGEKSRPVHVDDIGRALLRFENGASGSIEANWIASGQKMQHAFEIHGSRGALRFDQNRLNELGHYEMADPQVSGFRTILAGPPHAPYGEFCVAPGHQLGYNDLKAIEIRGLVEAIAGLRDEPFGFRSGLRIQRLVEAIRNSADTGQWVETGWADPVPAITGNGPGSQER